MRTEQSEMERMQSIHWHRVEFDLSESDLTPLTIAELLGEDVNPHEFLATKLAQRRQLLVAFSVFRPHEEWDTVSQHRCYGTTRVASTSIHEVHKPIRPWCIP